MQAGDALPAIASGSVTGIAVAAAGGLDAAIRSDMQASDCFRGGSEGGIAGCRVPAPAGLDELDLVRVQAAHGSYGELAAGRAGRVRHPMAFVVKRRVRKVFPVMILRAC